MSARVVEWSELVAERPLPAFAWQGRVAYHDSCHALRELRVKDAPRKLLHAVEGLEFVDLSSSDRCCGFGGTFSVRYPDVSVAMADSKLADVATAEVDVLASGRRRLPAAPGRAPVAHRLAGAHDPPRVAARGGAAMSDHLTGTTFQERAGEQLVKPFQRQAIPGAVDGTVAHLWHRFEHNDRPALRRLARDIRAHAVANLPELVARFADACEAAGTQVHFAADAAEANRIVVGICNDAGARLAVKSKSMLSEEIELNPALEAAGIEVVETDLGEYVVQLDGDRPSHVIAPIIHKTQGEVRELFSARRRPRARRHRGRADGVRPRAAARDASCAPTSASPAATSRRRDRHGRARHQRGQRPPVHVAAAGAHRPGGRRADRAAARRPRRADPAAGRLAAPARRSRPTSA